MCLFVDSLVGYRRSTWLSVVAVGSSAMRGTRSGVLLASFPPFSRSPFSWSPLFFVPFCGEKWVAAVPFISRTFCTVVTLSRRTRSRRSTPTSDFGRGFLPDVTLVNCSVSFLCVCVIRAHGSYFIWVDPCGFSWSSTTAVHDANQIDPSADFCPKIASFSLFWIWILPRRRKMNPTFDFNPDFLFCNPFPEHFNFHLLAHFQKPQFR